MNPQERTQDSVLHITRKPQSFKKKKHPGINLPKKMKDPYNKNYRTLKREIDAGTREWKNLSCS